MRGHLRKRGKSSWAIVVDVGRDAVTGKRRRKWISVKGTKRDAERRLAKIIHDLDAGTYVEPSRITLAEYLEQWMRVYVAISVRQRTAQGYRTIVRRIQRVLGPLMLADLKPQHIQQYYVVLLNEGLSAQTVKHHHRLLHQSIGQAVKWDMLARNIMERVTPPRIHKPNLPSLNPSEVGRLLTAAEGTDYHLPIYLALYTGLRRSEILGLQWSDVDLDARTLTVNRTMLTLTGEPMHINTPKSRGSRRAVAFGEDTTALLRLRSGALEAQVCARADGNPMTPHALSQGHRAIAAKCGVNVRFHDLRHTHASLLLAAGVPIHVVQARLGHASIQTTVDIYGHVLPASDVAAGMMLEAAIRGPDDLGRDRWSGLEQLHVG